ncbi:MAG: cell wall hydrolase [Candidatus Peribacteraceae bacterium]|nr:cell wall hydrolase [Candidatus Peribacteraceae bacterium]
MKELMLLVLSLFPQDEVKEIDVEQAFCLTTAIYFEAANQDYDGKIAVAHNISNRMKSKKFPNTICGVINQPKQYSFMHDGKSENVDIKHPMKKKQWIYSAKAAFSAMMGHTFDNTNGSLYYLNPELSTKRWADMLTTSYTQVAVVGDHTFYR